VVRGRLRIVDGYGDGETALVEGKALVKRFGDFEAVKGIDIEVRRGEAWQRFVVGCPALRRVAEAAVTERC
jgi:hypothetical protein